MRAQDIIELQFLVDRTSGSPDVTMGLVDGPITINHPDLNHASIREIPETVLGTCSKADSIACGINSGARVTNLSLALGNPTATNNLLPLTTKSHFLHSKLFCKKTIRHLSLIMVMN
jgi:hypothetical protein